MATDVDGAKQQNTGCHVGKSLVRVLFLGSANTKDTSQKSRAQHGNPGTRPVRKKPGSHAAAGFGRPALPINAGVLV
jgi:hypothetical protein